MRRAGQITAAARELAGNMVRPGVTTLEIDTAVRKFIESQGAKPSFLGYGGFPGSACISVNDEVIHGIPSKLVLQEGDIVSVDVGAYIGGFHGDCAGTYACGKISDEAARLIAVTEQSFWEGMKYARFGYRGGVFQHDRQPYAAGNSLIGQSDDPGIQAVFRQKILRQWENPALTCFGSSDRGSQSTFLNRVVPA